MRWLLALLLTMSLAHAAETYVVAVGVEKYDDEQVSSLQYAVADARSVAQAFRAAGTPFKNVTLLTSDEKTADRRPTRLGFVKALQAVRQKAVAGDRVVRRTWRREGRRAVPARGRRLTRPA